MEPARHLTNGISGFQPRLAHYILVAKTIKNELCTLLIDYIDTSGSWNELDTGILENSGEDHPNINALNSNLFLFEASDRGVFVPHDVYAFDASSGTLTFLFTVPSGSLGYDDRWVGMDTYNDNLYVADCYATATSSQIIKIAWNLPLSIPSYLEPFYTITVNNAYGNPTTSGSVAQGGNYATSVTSPWSGGTGIRYVCTGYSIDGGSQQTGTSYTFTNVQESHTITYNWQTQYYLTVTGGNSPIGQGWYNSGSSATVLSNGIWGRLGGTGTRVSSWNLDGGSNINVATTGTVTPSSIMMSTYHTVNFNSVTQYKVTLDSGAISALSLITNPAISGDNYWYDSGTSVSIILNGVWGRSGGTGDRLVNYAVNGGDANPTATKSTVTVFSGAISNPEFVTTTVAAQYFLNVPSGNNVTHGTAPTISGDTGWYDSDTGSGTPIQLDITIHTAAVTLYPWQNGFQANIEVANKGTLASDVIFDWALSDSHNITVASGVETVFLSGLDDKIVSVNIPVVGAGTYNLTVAPVNTIAATATQTLVVGRVPYEIIILAVAVAAVVIVLIIRKKWYRPSKTSSNDGGVVSRKPRNATY
jgi:hypothetical protein